MRNHLPQVPSAGEASFTNDESASSDNHMNFETTEVTDRHCNTNQQSERGKAYSDIFLVALL